MGKIKNHAFLHISDLHLGLKTPEDKYCSIIYEKTPDFYKKFFSCIKNELKERDAELKGVIITGDLADRGRIIDYQSVTEFLTKVSTSLNLSLNRFFITPGNHDINWADIEAYCYNYSIDKNNHENVKRLQIPKFKQFKLFYDEFFQLDIHPKSRFNPEKIIIGWDCLDRELGLSVLSLNSCHNCGLKGQSKGYIDKDQLEKELDSYPISKEDTFLKKYNIVLMHHVISHDQKNDAINENSISIVNKEELFPLFRKYNLLTFFSGHIHHDEDSRFYGISHQQIVAASLGKRIIDQKNFKNGFSLIIYPIEQEDEERLELFQHAYIYEPDGKEEGEAVYRHKAPDNTPDPISVYKTDWDSLRCFD